MQGNKFYFLLITTLLLPFWMGGCSSLAPVRSADNNEVGYFIAPTKAATPTPENAVMPTSSKNNQPANCTNQLTYEKDLTLPDGTFVDPGTSLDKQWQVKNEGTCNWDETYSLKLINGDAMGASDPQAIMPARGGTEAVIRIVFTAPTEPGKYTSTWQAYGPDGQPFGDYISILINVKSQ